MEPVSAHLSNSGLLRPVTAIGAESALRPDGRPVGAEVLQTADDGTVLLRVGTERVPAKTDVPLAPGETVALVAEQRDGELVLRLVSRAGPGLDRLGQVLGGLIGEERAAGAQVAELRAHLAAQVKAGGPDAAEAKALLEALDAGRFRPGMDGKELASRLGNGGQLALATLLAAALATREADSLEGLLKRLASAIRGRLATGLAAGGAPLDDEGLALALPGVLERALRELRRDANVRTARGLRALLGRLEGELARLLGHEGSLSRTTREQVLEQLARSGGKLLRGQEGAILRALVLLEGRHALTHGAGAEARAGLEADPMGRLFAQMLGGDGSEPVARRFAGQALEQLLNAARLASGEGLHHAIPLADAGGTATAHLFVATDERGEAGGPARRGFRAVVGVDLSGLGPVRADLLLWEGRLSVRVGVERPEVARELRERALELEAALSSRGLPVQLHVQESAPGAARVEDLVHDIRFLREHRLLDVEG